MAINSFPLTPLRNVLRIKSRPEEVEAEKIYNILGAHWYAEGLYIKETKPGASIQANRVYRVEEGDFVYNRLFAWKGSFAIASKENHNCYVSNEFPTFSIDQTQADAQYLWRYFSIESSWNEALGLSSGGTPTSRNRLKEEKLLAMEIPLPPVEEQRRIVARIEELANKIAQARELQQSAVGEAKELISSSMSSLITQPNIEKVKLENICFQVTDGEHATPPRILPDKDAIPLVTAKNVRDGFLDLATTDFVAEETAERCWSRCHPQHNDILMVCVGATTGRVCRLDQPPEMVIVRSVAMLRPDEKVIKSRFLEYALKSSFCQQQIWSLVKQAAQPCLYIYRMKQLMIPVPPIETQLNIIRHLDDFTNKMQQLKRKQSETAAELNALLPSVLDKAFKGEL